MEQSNEIEEVKDRSDVHSTGSKQKSTEMIVFSKNEENITTYILGG